MQRAIDYEIIGMCVMCNKNIKKGKLSARRIDGLWVCSLGCMDKLLKEKKKWNPKNWDELCKMQVLYEERRQTERKVPC